MDPASCHTRARIRVRWLFALMAATTVAFTLSPFTISLCAHELPQRARWALQADSTAGLAKAVGHVALFAVLGGLFAGVYETRCRVLGALRCLLWFASLCLTLESLQFLVPGRHARVSDMAGNTLGLWFGAQASLRGLRRGGVFVAIIEREGPTRLALERAIAIAAILIWTAAGVIPFVRLRNMEWSMDYRLMIGNQVDRSEPWRGELLYVAVYNQALAGSEVRAVYKRMTSGVRRSQNGDRPDQDLLLSYDFRYGGTNLVTSFGWIQSPRTSIVLPEGTERIAGGGVKLCESQLLVSSGPLPELTEAVATSGALSVVAWCAYAAGTTNAPQWIVSHSGGTWERNFMVGIQDSRLVFRVRNGVTEENGMKHVLQAPPVTEDGLLFVAVSYDHGRYSLMDGQGAIRATMDLREPTVFLGLGSGRPAWGVAGVLLVLGVLIPWHAGAQTEGRRRWRLGSRLAVMTVLGGGPYVLSWIILGGPWCWDLPLWMLGTMGASFPVARWYIVGPRCQRM